MPWFKCSHCRIRRSGLDVALGAAQDRCPLCARKLELERDLTSLVGFSYLTGGALSATARDAAQPSGAAGRMTDADIVSDALAIERWPDEGGGNEPSR